MAALQSPDAVAVLWSPVAVAALWSPVAVAALWSPVAVAALQLPVAVAALQLPVAVAALRYAAVFNQRTDIGGYFYEVIVSGAFTQAIGRDDVSFLIEHGGLPLARTRSGTLTLTEDSHGLKIDTTLDPADPDVARIVPKMKRGDLDKMSFGFYATRQEWDETGDIPSGQEYVNGSPIKAFFTSDGNLWVVVPPTATNISLVVGDMTQIDPWPYVVRSHQEEELLCYRYFYKVERLNMFQQGGNSGAIPQRMNGFAFPVTMRVVPTVGIGAHPEYNNRPNIFGLTRKSVNFDGSVRQADNWGWLDNITLDAEF